MNYPVMVMNKIYTNVDIKMLKTSFVTQQANVFRYFAKIEVQDLQEQL